MIKIWGRGNSVNVQKAVWAAAELGLDFERVDAGGAFGGLETKEYGRLNPNRRVPTLVDDGLVLWESQAIVRYLASKYGAGSLYPDDLRDRAIADQWMDWVQTTLFANMLVVFWGLIRTKAEDRDLGAIEKGVSGMNASFKILDNFLAGRSFILGDNLSMGDIPVGAYCWRYMGLDIERPAMPNLEAWYEKLKERKAFQDSVALPLS
jgi:glutathione S-transferase